MLLARKNIIPVIKSKTNLPNQSIVVYCVFVVDIHIAFILKCELSFLFVALSKVMRGVRQEKADGINSLEGNTTSSDYSDYNTSLHFTAKCKTNQQQQKLMDTGEGRGSGNPVMPSYATIASR